MSASANGSAPRHPGTILWEDYLEPAGISQVEFAAHIRMAAPSLNLLIAGKRAVSPRTAWKIARALGMQPSVWLYLQADWFLWKSRPKGRIKRHPSFAGRDAAKERPPQSKKKRGGRSKAAEG